MNKAFCKKRVFLSFLLTGCLILFNISCGLDVFYVIDGPITVKDPPTYSDIDKSLAKFDFWTVVPNNNIPVTFLGTNVYYKIYKSSQILENEVNNLVNIANNEETSYTAADKLIQTYTYQPLRAAGHYKESVLIPTSKDKNADYSYDSNSHVFIRLSDYTDSYLAEIKVDNTNIYNSSTRIIPVRNVANSYSFNFSKLPSTELPANGDADVNTNGSSTSDKEWYVAMFAVGVARDNLYTQMYSNILYLGSVTISTQ